MTNTPLLEIIGLRQQFNHQVILDNLCFQVHSGEILGLLGPNGAGKSTTFNMITGLLRPDSGDIRFMGRNMNAVPDYKYRIGVVPQDICLYDHFTVTENLRFIGRLYGIKGEHLKKTVNDLIEAVQLTGKRDTEISKLSGGMKRRINIAAALVHNPLLILMDEPTVGIDPQSRNLIWELIKDLKSKGKSIILTSHYVDEIEALSDRVIIIDRGSVIAEGTPELLIQQYGQSKRYTIDFYHMKPGLLEAIRQKGYKDVTVTDSRMEIVTATDESIAEDVFKTAMAYQAEIKTLDIQKPGLSDVFFYFTGRGLRE